MFHNINFKFFSNYRITANGSRPTEADKTKNLLYFPIKGVIILIKLANTSIVSSAFFQANFAKIFPACAKMVAMRPKMMKKALKTKDVCFLAVLFWGELTTPSDESA